MSVDPNNQSQVDVVLATIRQIESQNNYKSVGQSASRDAGAYQFITPMWQRLTQRYGIGTQYSTADLAPPAVQDQIANLYVQGILTSSGGDVLAGRADH